MYKLLKRNGDEPAGCHWNGRDLVWFEEAA